MSAASTTTRPRPGRRGRGRRRSWFRIALAAAGVAVGFAPVVALVWWMVAPGLRRPVGSSYLDGVEAAGQQDAAFALVCAVAGALTGIWWVLLRGPEQDRRSVARLVGLLIGGCAAGALAWMTGWGLDTLVSDTLGAAVTSSGTQPGADPAVTDPLPAVSAATVAAVLLWPLAAATLVFVDTLRDLVVRMLAPAEETSTA